EDGRGCQLPEHGASGADALRAVDREMRSEQGFEQTAHFRVVFDEQERACWRHDAVRRAHRGSRRWDDVRASSHALERLERAWQAHAKRRALSWFERQRAAVQLTELARQRKADPGADASGAVEGNEALEDCIAALFRNTGAVVDHVDRDEISLSACL